MFEMKYTRPRFGHSTNPQHINIFQTRWLRVRSICVFQYNIYIHNLYDTSGFLFTSQSVELIVFFRAPKIANISSQHNTDGLQISRIEELLFWYEFQFQIQHDVLMVVHCGVVCAESQHLAWCGWYFCQSHCCCCCFLWIGMTACILGPKKRNLIEIFTSTHNALIKVKLLSALKNTQISNTKYKRMMGMARLCEPLRIFIWNTQLST